jgi:hypothetical protein
LDGQFLKLKCTPYPGQPGGGTLFMKYSLEFKMECVQMMHIGSYDDEPKTVELMHKYMKENGYEIDINDKRFHHEIYLSDPRKCDIDKLKTVIRHPIKKC